MKQPKQRERYGSLIATVEAARYRVVAERSKAGEPGGYEAANPEQGFRASFPLGGMRVRPMGKASGWQLGLRLDGWGYGERLEQPGVPRVAVSGNRVEYRHGALTEWYVNTARGVEQGFTIEHPPARARGSEPLTLAVAVSGDLKPRRASDDRGIHFSGVDGSPVLGYAELDAWDAGGRRLPSRLALEGDQVRLIVDDAGAVYPLTVDPLLFTEAPLVASDGAADDQFGFFVAISGDTAVVGAPFHATGGKTDAGQAYVYVFDGTTWTLQQALAASDGAANDNFGFSVAIDGDTAVVGAPLHATGGKTDAGQVYVYVRSGNTWSEQQKVLASDGAANDEFGSSVAISGNTVVVGAPFHGPSVSFQPGQAYVYLRSGTTWAEQAKLKPPKNAATGDEFGFAVAISGDTAVVGAPFHSTAGNDLAGQAYVHVRSGTTWSRQAKLAASDGAVGDEFGSSVAISGGAVVVGAPDHTPGGNDFAGQAYVYVFNGTAWSEQAKLTASDGAAGDNFGFSVAIGSDTVVAGAPFHDAGQAYVYTLNGSSWSEQAKLAPSDGSVGDSFGTSLAISVDAVAVGSPFHATGGNNFAGQAYVYVSTSALTGLGQANLWVGIGNLASAGIEFDLQVKVFVNSTLVGNGKLRSVIAGATPKFSSAILQSIPLKLLVPGFEVPSGSVLKFRVQVRNACNGSAQPSGVARLWFNGAAVDTGVGRDAGSRFDATIGSASSYFLRSESGLVLDTTAGASRQKLDAAVGAPCGSWVTFGTWTKTMP